MNTLCIVTGNANKFKSIERELRKRGIRSVQKSVEIPEPRSYDIREIATAKALFAYGNVHKPVIIEDSGFFIDSLNGFPRTFVHYALDVVGIGGMLRLAEGKKRSCEFRSCLAYYDGKGEPRLFESIVRGKIAKKPAGRKADYHWSELFLIFIPKGKKQTLAQMKKEDYLKWYSEVQENSNVSRFAEWYLGR